MTEISDRGSALALPDAWMPVLLPGGEYATTETITHWMGRAAAAAIDGRTDKPEVVTATLDELLQSVVGSTALSDTDIGTFRKWLARDSRFCDQQADKYRFAAPSAVVCEVGGHPAHTEDAVFNRLDKYARMVDYRLRQTEKGKKGLATEEDLLSTLTAPGKRHSASQTWADATLQFIDRDNYPDILPLERGYVLLGQFGMCQGDFVLPNLEQAVDNVLDILQEDGATHFRLKRFIHELDYADYQIPRSQVRDLANVLLIHPRLQFSPAKSRFRFYVEKS